MKNIPPILYAEDSQNDIELTLSALSECNLHNKIDVVRDGQQVLDYLRYQGEYSSRKKENPVVILLDIKMPKLDGYKPSVSLKLPPVLKHIPIVMLTSSAMESDIVESYDLGVNAYVVKPIDFSEFVKKIKNIGIF